MPNTPLLTADLLVDLIIIVVFMTGVSRFRTPSGARLGNALTSIAFAVAVGLVFWRNDITEPVVVFAGLGIGALAGWLISARITMTRIPALIAIQNGAGGGASALVSIVELLRSAQSPSTLSTVFGCIGLIVGSVALSGSVLAAAKLENRISPRPKLLPAHNLILLGLLAVAVTLSLATLGVEGVAHTGAVVLIGIAALSLGVLFAIRIGGADMPVLISFLNTLSGLAAAFVGVSLGNQMLVAAGAMVGSSGLILTWVMCTNMNRTLLGVLTGHSVKIKHPEPVSCDLPVSGDARSDILPHEAPQSESRSAETVSASANPRSAALRKLNSASEVVIVPGYGMAQARAQMEVAALATKLEGEGKRVRFAVHPVAGRMPGHMHVLLAEADVDYDKLFEMDQINDEFAETDVVLVVGACDVVNPAAIDVPDTPISGMPILKAYEAARVIVCNLDAKPGYSGVENPLYDDPKTILLFGDAKETVDAVSCRLD